MYSLGSIERRLVRDDAELGREFGDGYEWLYWNYSSRLWPHKSTFNGDISKWDTGKVINMYSMFRDRFCVQPRHWELEHRESDSYEFYVSYRFFVQPRHWELEYSASD